MLRWVASRFGAAAVAASLFAAVPGLAKAPQSAGASLQTASAPSDSETESFLLRAKIVTTRSTARGVTDSLRATLSDGTRTHDAHIQSVDVRAQQFTGTRQVEFNFRDSWTFNIAAYRIDRLIGMDMVPVSVPRTWHYKDAAFTWWVDDVVMDEQERIKRKAHPPDVEAWNRQMQMVRLFDQLIANVDRNLGNLVITRDWRLWPIDHTRAFRANRALTVPANVTRADRAVVERMKRLDRESLRGAVGRFLTDSDIGALLARRDAILARLAGLGESALFDRPAR